MKRTFVQIDGVLVEYDRRTGERVAPDVMPDIAPYRSMLTGEMITSRSRHREHLRDRGYEEIGNDSSLNRQRSFPDAAPQQRKDILRAQVSAMTNKQFDAARMKDLNRLRWQTNGIPDPLKEM